MTRARPVRWVGLIAAATVLMACSAQQVYVGPVNSSVAVVASPSASPVLGPATPGMPGVGRFYTIRIGGLERRYRLHLPLTSPQGPRPLVIALHAAGSSPSSLANDSGLDGAGDRNGVIIAYPEAIGGVWNDGLRANAVRNAGVDDVAFLYQVLVDVGKRTRVDYKRVTIAGIGDGASMALRYAALRPQDVVGVVAIEGGLITGLTPTLPRTPTSVTFIRGDADPSLPWIGLDLKARAGPQLGAAQTLAVYLGLDGLAGTKPTVDETIPDRDPLDGTRVRQTQWGPGKDGKFVTLYTVVGGGSPFPGGLPDTRDFARVGRVTRDLSGASVIVRFALETH